MATIAKFNNQSSLNTDAVRSATVDFVSSQWESVKNRPHYTLNAEGIPFLVEDRRQVERQQNKFLLSAPSVSPSLTDQIKRKLIQMDDGDNNVHPLHHHQKKVHSNKRLHLNQQQDHSNSIASIGLAENGIQPPIPFSSSSVFAAAPNDVALMAPTTTVAFAASVDRRAVNNNVLLKAQHINRPSVQVRPIVPDIFNDSDDDEVVNIAGPIQAASIAKPRQNKQQLLIQQQGKEMRVDTAAKTSKQNDIRSDDDETSSSNEERFLQAFETKPTYSKSELARVTKLSMGRIHQLVSKYCDKVSPLSRQSKVFLKPEFHSGRNAHQPVVFFAAAIPTNVVFVPPISSTSFIPLSSSSSATAATAGENQTNRSASVRSARKDMRFMSSSTHAAVGAISIADDDAAKRVTTFRKIACKRQASDISSNSVDCITMPFISSAAKKMRYFDNAEKNTDADRKPAYCSPSTILELQQLLSTPHHLLNEPSVVGSSSSSEDLFETIHQSSGVHDWITMPIDIPKEPTDKSNWCHHRCNADELNRNTDNCSNPLSNQAWPAASCSAQEFDDLFNEWFFPAVACPLSNNIDSDNQLDDCLMMLSSSFSNTPARQHHEPTLLIAKDSTADDCFCISPSQAPVADNNKKVLIVDEASALQHQQPQSSSKGDILTALLINQNKMLTTALEPPVTGRGLPVAGQHLEKTLKRRIDNDDLVQTADHYIIQPKSKRFRPIDDREKEAIYNRIDYRQLHPFIDDRQRRNVLEWLHWICTKLQWHLQAETFHLATDFFDRFMSSSQSLDSIATLDLSLIGIASLHIAIKVVELNSSLWGENLAKLTNATKKDIFDMDARILNAIEWEMSSKSPIHFLDNFIEATPILFMLNNKKDHYDRVTKLLASASIDIGSLQFPNSLIAQAAVHHCVSKEAALEIKYSKVRLTECITWMNEIKLKDRMRHHQTINNALITHSIHLINTRKNVKKSSIK